MTVRIGLIGVGRIGQLAHLQNLVGNPACRVLAVADLRPDLARQVAAKFAVPRVYEDHHALLADAEIDAVIVVTHRYQTAAVVRDALRARKHVLSEKPMALDSATGGALVALAREKGVLYGVGYMKRYDPWVALAKQVLDEKGTPRLIRLSCLGGDTERNDAFLMTGEARPSADACALMPPWLPTHLHQSYDTFLNVYSHDVDLAGYLAGDGLAVAAAHQTAPHCHHVQFRNAAHVIELKTAAQSAKDWREQVEVLWDDGTLSVRLPAPLDADAPGAATFAAPHPRSLAPQHHTWAFATQAHAFVRAVRGEAPFRSTGAEALRALTLSEDIFRAYSS